MQFETMRLLRILLLPRVALYALYCCRHVSLLKVLIDQSSSTLNLVCCTTTHTHFCRRRRSSTALIAIALWTVDGSDQIGSIQSLSLHSILNTRSVNNYCPLGVGARIARALGFYSDF